MKGKIKSGFTLAEVLIALVVIGIIAAITMTTVMPNIQERANSQRQANIVYKVTQATNLMKANGAMVEGFASTDAFVDELQKYLKIMKRCDSEHIADCWPTKTVRTSEGKDFEVSKTKTRENLGFKDEGKDTKNVGIVLADGACLIMTYDIESKGLSIGDPLTSKTTFLPVGGKFQTFLEYTSNTTSGLAFVMDVNGSKGPNSETIGTKMYDIRNLNGAHFSKGCGGFKVNSTCYTPIASWEGMDCTRNKTTWELNNPKNAEYCPSADDHHEYALTNPNYWAGAKKTCNDLDMKLPNKEEAKQICKSHIINIQERYNTEYIYIWTSDTNGAGGGYQIWLHNCNADGYLNMGFTSNQAGILCIDK